MENPILVAHIIMKKMKKLLFGITFLILCSQVLFAQKVDSITATKAWDLELAFRHERDSIIRENMNKSYLPISAVSLNGISISEKLPQGEVTIINFWFDCCNNFARISDKYNMLYDSFKSNPKFQFISFVRDDIKIAEDAVEKYNILYEVYPVSNNDFIG
jgi:hypothetical protein